MVDVEMALVANVAEAGDIVLMALALVIAFVVGVVLYWIDGVVGRVRRRAGREPSPENHPTG